MTIDRRGVLTACSRAGITSALLSGVLYTLAAQAHEPAADHKDTPKITAEMIDQAAHYQNAKLAAFTCAYQQVTGFHKRPPPTFAVD